MKLSDVSDFYCTECGHKGIPVIRKVGREKEPGHLKKLFCLYCNKETNHVEIRPNGKYNINDFFIEYSNGNFVEGKRQLPYKQFEAKMREREEV